MSTLIIPENINELSPIEQVLLFHDAGASVFAIDPPGKKKSNGKTLNKPGKERPSPPERDEVYHQFGNGNDFNIGVYPPAGYIIVNLDAVDKDRGRVDRFLDSNSSLGEVPRVQTARGYHLYFRADAPPRTLLKPSIVPQVNFHVITCEKYAIVPPSRHAEGLKYIWKKTGEPPVWTAEHSTAFNLPEEQREPPQEPQADGNGARRGASVFGLTIPGNEEQQGDLDFIDGIEIHILANRVFNRLAETNEYFVQAQSRKLVRYDRTARLAEVSADQLRIRLGKLYRVRRTKGLGQVQLHPATASKEDALLLLASGDEMRKHLDEVERVVKHPLLVSEENGEPKIIASREVHNGVFVDSSDVIPVVSLSEAVPAILGLFCDFKFTTPSDLSRAVGHLLSPALVFGGLVPGRVPFHIVEADYPGSGKGFLQDLVLSIYNEEAGIVTEINKGVGGIEETPVFVRIQKQVEGYRWHKFEDGKKAMQHVQSQRTFYLGCVYSVLSEWIRQGKPQIEGSPHRFEDWAGSIDWIVRNLFHLAPLLDGHKEVQKAVASPILVFLRQAAIQVEKEGMLADQLKASALVELAQRHNLTFPGLKDYDDQAAKTLGLHMGRVFKQSDALNLDSYQIVRVASSVKRDDEKGYKEVKAYCFFRTPPSPGSQKGSTRWGETESDPGNPSTSPGDAADVSKNPVSEANPTYSPPTPHQVENQVLGGACKVPQHQGVTTQKIAFPHQLHLDSPIFSQDLSPVVVNKINEGVVEKKVVVLGGVGGVGVVLDDNSSSMVSNPCGDMSFSLIRKKSELTAVAETLAGLQKPLAIDLKTYNKSTPDGSYLMSGDEIRLLSIKAPGLPPWLIDLKEIGYDLGADLRNILQNREIIFDDHENVALALRKKCGVELNSVWRTNKAHNLLFEEKEKTGSSKIPVWEQHLLINPPPKDPGTYTDKHGDKHHGTYWRDEITEEQYQYAAASVEYLHPLKTVLEEALANSPMLHVFHYLNGQRPSGTSFVAKPFTEETRSAEMEGEK